MSTAPVTVLPLDECVKEVEPTTALVLKNAFVPFLTQAKEWTEKAATVTDPKIARASRLTLKKIRCDAAAEHKKLKADILIRGRAIDGMLRVVEGVILPIENAMEEIEKAAERAEAARKEALRAERSAILAALGVNPAIYMLADISAEDFASITESAKLAKAAREEAARKAEEERLARERAEAEERLAREKAAAEERARIEAENARLRAEAAAREEAARLERERAAKERAAAEAKLREEREARAKLEAEARAQREAEEARQRKEAEEAARLAAAPDREKLRKLAGLVLTLEVPEMSTAAGKRAAADVKTLIRSLSKDITAHAENL